MILRDYLWSDDFIQLLFILIPYVHLIIWKQIVKSTKNLQVEYNCEK